MATGVQQTIQFAPWTRMLMENAVSPFWGEGQGVPVCHLQQEADHLAG